MCRKGKFDDSRVLSDGSLMKLARIYPMDAAYDRPGDVPASVFHNKRYARHERYTISEVATSVKKDCGCIDIVVHSLANGPQVNKDLLDTSRLGYGCVA